MIGQQLHLRGTYQRQPSECIGQVEGFITDREGDWVKIKLTGSPHAALQEWRRSCNEEFFANRHVRIRPSTDGVDVLCSRVLRSRPLLRVEIQPSGIADGRGRSARACRGSPRSRVWGESGKGPRISTSSCPPRARGGSTTKEQKVERQGSDQEHGEIKHVGLEGSSLDLGFRRPRINLKRKKEESESLDSSGRTVSQDLSDQEDLFPEEAQSRHIARKCPGLLARHAIKEARKRLLADLGEDVSKQAVFVRYFRQVFDHSGASTPMKGEYLTLAHCLDSILEGNVLRCLDIAIQRLKAVEQVSQGVPPQSGCSGTQAGVENHMEHQLLESRHLEPAGKRLGETKQRRLRSQGREGRQGRKRQGCEGEVGGKVEAIEGSSSPPRAK